MPSLPTGKVRLVITNCELVDITHRKLNLNFNHNGHKKKRNLYNRQLSRIRRRAL